jgi:colicin import membrane protein
VASKGGLSALALGEIGAGVILAWSGIANASLTATAHSLISGKAPAADTGSEPLGTVSDVVPAVSASTSGGGGSVGGAPPDTATVAGYKAYILTLSIAHGWGPAGAAAWEQIVSLEDASYGPDVENGEGSGALGIAQALGHGTAATAGTLGNQYGNYGTSDSVCKAANSGSGTAQLEWMGNYIAERYGTPQAALAFHLANNSY